MQSFPKHFQSTVDWMENVEPAIWRDESKAITYILPVVKIKVPLPDSSLILSSQIHLGTQPVILFVLSSLV